MDIWLPPTPAHVLGNMGQWEGQGAGERAAAPSALPLQEGMRQGVQFVHLLLDLQVGPLAEARGGADGSPSTHPAMGDGADGQMEISTKVPLPAWIPHWGGHIGLWGCGATPHTWVISRMDITLSRAFCSRS